MKKVSVIINTKNEEADIKDLLISISNQTYKKVETIVVDNFSTDKTREIAEKYNTRFFSKGPERSAQRNFGAKNSRGEYLLFVDADMRLPRTLISDCTNLIERKIKVGGIIIPEKSVGEGYWVKVKAFERSFYIGDDSIESARFYRKKAFEQTGGFNESIVGFEDLDLSNRVRKNWEIDRVRAKIIHYEGKLTLFSMAKKSAYYAKTSGKLLKSWNKSPFNPQTFYFLRSSYYKNWKKLVKHPVLSVGMIIMLTTQLVFGGVSYIKNK